jgi:hypothetical protein
MPSTSVPGCGLLQHSGGSQGRPQALQVNSEHGGHRGESDPLVKAQSRPSPHPSHTVLWTLGLLPYSEVTAAEVTVSKISLCNASIQGQGHPEPQVRDSAAVSKRPSHRGSRPAFQKVASWASSPIPTQCKTRRPCACSRGHFCPHVNFHTSPGSIHAAGALLECAPEPGSPATKARVSDLFVLLLGARGSHKPQGLSQPGDKGLRRARLASNQPALHLRMPQASGQTRSTEARLCQSRLSLLSSTCTQWDGSQALVLTGRTACGYRR